MRRVRCCRTESGSVRVTLSPRPRLGSSLSGGAFSLPERLPPRILEPRQTPTFLSQIFGGNLTHGGTVESAARFLCRWGTGTTLGLRRKSWGWLTNQFVDRFRLDEFAAAVEWLAAGSPARRSSGTDFQGASSSAGEPLRRHFLVYTRNARAVSTR